MQRMLIIVLCAAAICGCEPASVEPSVTAVGAADAVPATSPAPTVMALVNGRPIYMEELYTELLEADGLETAEILIIDRLINREATRRGVSASADEIDAQGEQALDAMFKGQFTLGQRDQLLTRLLKDKGVTRKQWNAAMRRSALLRKMIEPDVRVDEANLKAEFVRLYGGKRQVRHISLPSYTEAEKVLALVGKGEDFAALVRKYSTDSATAQAGGTMPPFTRVDSTIPQAIRDVAFSLAEGQVSEIVQVGSSFHVLELIRQIAPAQAEYETVRESLREQVRQRLTEIAQADLLVKLRRRASIEWVHPHLRRQADRAAQP